MPFLTQGKTNWKYILIVVVLAVTVGGLALYYHPKFPEIGYPTIKPPRPEKYSCDIDVDCVVRRVNCSACSFESRCINKKWEDCELSPPPLLVYCPPPAPSPLWPKSCECINSRCATKEVIGETANWKIYNSPDNILQARVIPVGKTKESIIEIWTNEGKSLQREDHTSEDGEHGLTVARAEWTPDSQFFIYSAYSSGGHQPWFSRVYFYSRFDNKIYNFREVSGFTVGREEFAMTSPDIVTFTVYTCVGMGPPTIKSFKMSEVTVNPPASLLPCE